MLGMASLILFGIFWTKKFFSGLDGEIGKICRQKQKKGKIERKKWKHTYPPQVCLNHDWRLTKRERGRERGREGGREGERERWRRKWNNAVNNETRRLYKEMYFSTKYFFRVQKKNIFGDLKYLKPKST